MKVRVTLISLTSRTEPELNDGSEGTVEAAYGATLAQVLEGLNLPGESYSALVNGTVVPPSERGVRRLSDSDSLTVFPHIKGG